MQNKSYNENITKLQIKAADMSNKIRKEQQESVEKARNERLTQLQENAHLAYGSVVNTNKIKAQNALRNLNYEEHFTVSALTEALSQVAEKALLLDEEEYSALNPNYKAEIKSTISSFLTKADINESANSKVLLDLFEQVKVFMPKAETYLTEEDEHEIIEKKVLSQPCIQRNLDTLCRDVRARVANIVSKDQEKLADEQKTLDMVAAKEAEKAPLVEVQPEVDPYAPIQDPEQSQPAEQTPVAPVMESVTKIVNMPRVQYIKESKKCGITETLAINEAHQMLSEGKEYNSTLALANAIKLITCLEALDASGAVTIGQQGYNDMLAASGAELQPECACTELKPECDSVVQCKEPLVKADDVCVDKDRKEQEITDKICEITKDAVPTGIAIKESRVFVPFSEWIKTNSNARQTLNENVESVSLCGKYTKNGEVFTEEQLKEKFMNEGYSVELMNEYDFAHLCYSFNYIKR